MAGVKCFTLEVAAVAFRYSTVLSSSREVSRAFYTASEQRGALVVVSGNSQPCLAYSIKRFRGIPYFGNRGLVFQVLVLSHSKSTRSDVTPRCVNEEVHSATACHPSRRGFFSLLLKSLIVMGPKKPSSVRSRKQPTSDTPARPSPQRRATLASKSPRATTASVFAAAAVQRGAGNMNEDEDVVPSTPDAGALQSSDIAPGSQVQVQDRRAYVSTQLRQPQFSTPPTDGRTGSTGRATVSSAANLFSQVTAGSVEKSARQQESLRKRQLEAAYKDAVPDKASRPGSKKKKKLLKMETVEAQLIVEANHMYDGSDGQKVIEHFHVAKKMLVEHVLRTIATRGEEIDTAVQKSEPCKRKFPGLAILCAKSPKLEGNKPSEHKNPDERVYSEGIRALGSAFYDPIIELVILTALRQYKVYTEMTKKECSEDEADRSESQRMFTYLRENCPQLLSWKCGEGDGRRGENAKLNAMHMYPLLRMLQLLERTSAGRTYVIPGKQEKGVTIHTKVVRRALAYIRDENKKEPGASKKGASKKGKAPWSSTGPDRAVYTVLKETHTMIQQGLKHFTDAGRKRAYEFFTKKIGAVYFKMATSGTSHISAKVPSTPVPPPGIAVKKHSSGLEHVAQARALPLKDEHMCRIAIPQKEDGLEAMMSAEDLRFNKEAVEELVQNYPHMRCNISAIKFIIKKDGNTFDKLLCSRTISKLEDKNVDDPASVEVEYSYNLHPFALRFLCKYLEIPNAAALLATSECSLKAVHALALTFLGILRAENTGEKLCPVAEAHKGPMEILYTTQKTCSPHIIGLMGVKKPPLSLRPPAGGEGDDSSDNDVNESQEKNQYDRDMSGLNDVYKEAVKELMFISHDDCEKVIPGSHKFKSRAEDSDGSDGASEDGAPDQEEDDDSINDDVGDLGPSY